MNKIKVPTLLELSETISENDIVGFDGNIGKGQFPIIIILDDDYNYLGFIEYSDFVDSDFLSRVQRTLEWHQGFIERQMPTSELQVLLSARASLSRDIEFIGRLKSEAAAAYKAADFKRKRVMDNLVLVYRDKGESVVVAKAKARGESEAYDKAVVSAQEYRDNAFALYDSVNQTLNAMSAEIKQLAKEESRAAIA